MNNVLWLEYECLGCHDGIDRNTSGRALVVAWTKSVIEKMSPKPIICCLNGHAQNRFVHSFFSFLFSGFQSTQWTKEKMTFLLCKYYSHIWITMLCVCKHCNTVKTWDKLITEIFCPSLSTPFYFKWHSAITVIELVQHLT